MLTTKQRNDLYTMYPRTPERLARDPTGVEEIRELDNLCPRVKELPDELTSSRARRKKDLSYKRPPKLYYGFGMDFLDFVDYYDRNAATLPRVLPDLPPNCHPSAPMGIIKDIVEDHLTTLCTFLITTAPVSSPDYWMVIPLYNNFNIYYAELEDHDEEEVLQILRDQFPFLKNEQPRWFYAA